MLWRKVDIREIPKSDVLDHVVLTTFIGDLKKEKGDENLLIMQLHQVYNTNVKR